MPKLTMAAIKALSKPGRYSDGGTLYLYVAPGGSKSWVQRVTINSCRHDIGLGPWPVVSLAKARRRAFANRVLIEDGGDPLAEKRKAEVPTFQQAAVRVHAANLPRWRSAKVAALWLKSMERYAFPTLGDKRVDQVGREDVLRILSPIWTSKPEAARKLRLQIRTTLRWAQGHGYVETNAAGEAIDGALPPQPSVRSHHRTIPYSEVAGALEAVDESAATKAVKLCFRFLVLTAARGGEARLATWQEIDLEAREWRIPGERMKAGQPHVVPLSDAALAVLSDAAEIRETGSDLIFPGTKHGRPLTDSTLSKLLREVGVTAVPHGFRAAFRTWASEKTNAPHHVMELALAHSVGSQVERAYARSDLRSKRRALMQRWGDYATAEQTKVVQLHG
ncbi:MAG: tyrosine-type recombinase/integrase [Rhodospirillales bacterium]|nr:tyrosine-type recombinase/integrase [Rhodospirillales bacterium]